MTEEDNKTGQDRHVGFGLEKIGLVCARWPRIAAIILLSLFVIALNGAAQVKQEDQISALFRSDGAEFLKFDAVQQLFRESENDVAIILEADDVLTRERLQAALDTYLDVYLLDGVASVFSLFTLRVPPDEEGVSDPIFPSPLPRDEEYQELRDLIESHPLIMGRTVSHDKTNILIVAALDSNPDISLQDLVASIRKTAEEIAGPVGMQVHLAGVPALRVQIKTALSHDRAIFNIVGYLLGVLICLIFLRSFGYAALAAAPPLVAVVFSLSILGYAGIPLNALSNVLPPLVMVLAFADSMHMAFAVRDGVSQGMTGPEAAAFSVRRVGPACVLTSLTTALALASVTLASSDLISSFGLAAFLGAIVAFVSVITVVPTIAALVIKAKSRRPQHAVPLVDSLSKLCAGLGGSIARRPRVFALSGIVLVILGLWASLSLDPHYRISAYLPDNDQIYNGVDRMDRQFGGAVDILAVVRWEGQSEEQLREVVAAVRDVHNAMDSHPQITNAWSIEAIRLWLTDGESTGGVNELAKFIASLPAHWLDRLLAPVGNAALVAGRVQDLEAAGYRVIADELEVLVAEAIRPYPGVTVEITGISTLSSRMSGPMIQQLGLGLLTAILTVLVLIAISFRSIRVALLSFLPNLLPVVLGGACLWLAGVGLRYETVIALTVAFGIAVDDTIHFLYHLGRRNWAGATPVETVLGTLKEIGPILILTTLVLSVGFSVTFASSLPQMRAFGMVSMAVLFFALMADLLFLPALVLWNKNKRKAD